LLSLIFPSEKLLLTTILKIIDLWIVGEELKYPLEQDIGLHAGKLRGR